MVAISFVKDQEFNDSAFVEEVCYIKSNNPSVNFSSVTVQMVGIKYLSLQQQKPTENLIKMCTSLLIHLLICLCPTRESGPLKWVTR